MNTLPEAKGAPAAKRWISVGFGCAMLALCIGSTRAAEPNSVDAPADVPILWKGVEVITNDFPSIERVRQAAALAPGTLLPLSDPKLKIACDAVRGKFRSSKVSCSNVIESATEGPPRAWYLVEVDIPEREPLRCLAGARLDPRLAALSQQWRETIGRSVLKGTATGEHVNERDYLDYDDAELSAFAARIYQATRARTIELEATSVSCNAQERAHSFYLMNFAGDPQKFVTMAAARINDADSGAANAATRFLVLFAGFIDPGVVPHVATEACKSVLDGGFTGRQKSLSLLIQLRDQGVLSFDRLGPDCQRQIRDIARTSLALPARELLSEPAR